jgi:hypothetical protein
MMCKVASEKGVKIGQDINVVSVGGEKEASWTKETAKYGMVNIRGTSALSGLDRSVRWKYGGICPIELIAATLKRICQGMKVCVEIGLMAADQEEIPVNKDIISIAGTHAGADTAIVMRASRSDNFFHEDEGLVVREVICMPFVRSPPGWRRVYGAHGV